MTLNTEEIIAIISTLAEHENLRITAKASLKGGIIIGASGTIGGLLLGPIGLLTGGIIGSVLSFLTSEKFLSVPKVIETMKPETKMHLVQNLRNIIADIDISDVAILISMLHNDASLRNKIIYELTEFFRKEMSMALVKH